ncbi:MAG TPA: transporter substrate-binding domain-containing protein [Terriglobia bacterium]|nr:transporter substrate-binding domain-containing protein [Terriglobia bacterium]
MSSAARLELTPKGKLRAGINLGNTVLARRSVDGVLSGIAVDLATELARRLGADLDPIIYDAAGPMADGARAGAWDVAFLAADPARAGEIAFTAPYLAIDSTYLVPDGSALKSVADVDQDGIRIALSEKSAYDLYLTRNIRRARLVRAAGPPASADLFFRDNLDALAGIRPMLLDVARAHPGTRVLDDAFTAVQQAIGAPAGRKSAVAYLDEFVADIQSSGLLKTLVEKHAITGVTVVARNM